MRRNVGGDYANAAAERLCHLLCPALRVLEWLRQRQLDRRLRHDFPLQTCRALGTQHSDLRHAPLELRKLIAGVESRSRKAT
eukprot:1813389-Rhodomonas_salina.1